MIGMIETNSYPNFRCVLFSGSSLFGSIPGYNFLPLKKAIITNTDNTRHDLIKSALQSALINIDLSVLVESEIVNKFADILASIDVKYSVVGLSRNDKFFFGIPSDYHLSLPDFNNLKIFISIDAQIAYKDTLDFCVGLSVKVNPLSVQDVRVKSGEVDLNLASDSEQGKFLEAITPFTNVSVLANTTDGTIIIDGQLRAGGRLNEKESIIYLDTLNDLIEIYRLADEVEVQTAIDVKRNSIVRSSMDLHRDVIAFGNTLLDKLSKVNPKDVTLVCCSSATVKAIRTFNSATQGWHNILSKNNYNYSMLKDCLERNLSLSDSLGSVYYRDAEDWKDKIKVSLLTKQIGNYTLNIGATQESDAAFELVDETISLSKDAIKKAISLDNIKNSIKSNKLEVLSRAMRYRNEVQLEYSKIISQLNTAYNEYSKALNNEKLSSAAAKVYLEQLDAIERLEVRSWWNNSLMGTVRSFITSYTDDGSKLIPQFDKERLKICYRQVSSNCEYKWESCDYWIVERSGSPDHTYFGREGVETARTRDDWRSNETNYPVTIPESSLTNLSISFDKAAPQTATWQYYTDCGKRKTVIEPVAQISRPKLGVDTFITKFTQVLSELQQKYYQFAKLVSATQDIRQSIIKTIKSLEIRKGELEAKSFSAKNLESYALFLEKQENYYDSIEINSDNMQGQLALTKSSSEKSDNSYPLIVALSLEQFLTVQDINYADCIVNQADNNAEEEGSVSIDLTKTLNKVKEKFKTYQPVLRYAGQLVEDNTINIDKYTVKLKVSHELGSTNLNVKINIKVDSCEINESPSWTTTFNGYEWSKSDILLFAQLASDVFDSETYTTYVLKPLLQELNLRQEEFEEELLQFRSSYLSMCKMKSTSVFSKLSYLLLNNRQLTPIDYLVSLAANRQSLLMSYNQAVACFFSNYIEEIAYVN